MIPWNNFWIMFIMVWIQTASPWWFCRRPSGPFLRN